MVWSHAVLEHIRAAEFADYSGELARITTAAGRGSHRVNLQDHLVGALNNLRFSAKTCESTWFTQSGFYTNRLHYSRIINAFRSAGFEVDTPKVDRWESSPTPRHLMDPAFRDTPDDELLVSGFDMVVRKLRASNH